MSLSEVPEGTPLSDVLKRASDEPKHPPELKPGHVAFAPLHVRNASSDNVKRIAEFVTKLTWREITTIANAVEIEYQNSGPPGDERHPDLAQAFVVWAEKLLGEAGT